MPFLLLFYYLNLLAHLLAVITVLYTSCFDIRDIFSLIIFYISGVKIREQICWSAFRSIFNFFHQKLQPRLEDSLPEIPFEDLLPIIEPPQRTKKKETPEQAVDEEFPAPPDPELLRSVSMDPALTAPVCEVPSHNGSDHRQNSNQSHHSTGLYDNVESFSDLNLPPPPPPLDPNIIFSEENISPVTSSSACEDLAPQSPQLPSQTPNTNSPVKKLSFAEELKNAAKQKKSSLRTGNQQGPDVASKYKK